MEKQKTKRQLSFQILKKSLSSINVDYINLYFNRTKTIKVKCVILKDSLEVIADKDIKKYKDKIDYEALSSNLSKDQRRSFKSLSDQIEIAINAKQQVTLSTIVRGVLGPLVNNQRTTINYNVYVEMDFLKQDIIRLDKFHESIFASNKEEYIQLGDYIETVSKYSEEYKEFIGSDINEYQEDTLESENKGDQHMNIDQINPSTMITHINDYIHAKGFIFSKEDISNLYLSLKTKPFVLLAGISGTGKSKLVQLFAEAIGANRSNGRYSLISVKPDWNDGTDLFGYIDINEKYKPGILTEIVYQANQPENLDKPYLICLDEMNLARVEYYFSDYLSIIETREKIDGVARTCNIFPKGYLGDENKYSHVYFSDNIYIIGTVNMDDTTFSFSEKVLDRANTIEFSKVDLAALDFTTGEVDPMTLDNGNFKTSYLTIKEALEKDKDYVEQTNNQVIAINHILKQYNRHFGYRVRDEIVFYMLENDGSAILPDYVAFDYQILQKVLPKISGSDYEIKKLLIDIYNYLNPGVEIIEAVGYVEDINIENSQYPKSTKKIKEMLRSYENGYTSFW